MNTRAMRSLLAFHLPILAGLLVADRAQADSKARWSFLHCAVSEAVPRVYPDTQACYLIKDIEARTDVAYRVDFDLPYATYSSTTTYADNKPYAYLVESSYVVRNDRGRQVPNPYQPGSVVVTPRSARKVRMFVTPNYNSCVGQRKDNCIATNSNPAVATRNQIFQRVYYANRTDPETGQPFRARSNYDRLGYTQPPEITCVNPSNLDQEVTCPRFPLFRDLPNLDLNPGRSPAPNLQASHPECRHRLRWDRPQAFWTHWAGPGSSVDATGTTAPDTATTCTGYLVSMIYDLALDSRGNPRSKAAHMVSMTYIRTPPSFFDVSTLNAGSRLPFPPPDVRYVGIQNYGEAFSDVVYNEQSRAVGEIPIFAQGRGRHSRDSWVFLHFSRPVESGDENVIRTWGSKNDVSVQQLAIFDPALPLDQVPPFLIYRQKEPSRGFLNSPGSITNNVPCYPWQPDPPNGPTQDWISSPLQNAASATRPDGLTVEQAGFVPVSITCEYEPGTLRPRFLDECLNKLLGTNPSWFKSDGGTTCDPAL